MTRADGFCNPKYEFIARDAMLGKKNRILFPQRFTEVRS